MINLTDSNPELLNAIRLVLSESRTQLQYTVNKTMVHANWHVGRLIIENEQHGAVRASYGKQQIKDLSKHLSYEFGKGYDERNLRNMRSFYLAYPKWNTVCFELS
ncbi:TPA: DUF1016 N-terminal domain-containing protein [Legionella pneumophila]|nr:DUF1016 N-terminal domain-containing protein [Legionella pneumophila]MCK1859566.1 DUF1016 N-terminal domain-containing protein [Legionella pneumophila]